MNKLRQELIDDKQGVDILNFNELAENFKQEILNNKEVYIKYKQVQVKKHKKKRINKKWLKRYGTKPVPICTVELFEKVEDILNLIMLEKIEKMTDEFIGLERLEKMADKFIDLEKTDS